MKRKLEWQFQFLAFNCIEHMGSKYHRSCFQRLQQIMTYFYFTMIHFPCLVVFLTYFYETTSMNIKKEKESALCIM